MRKLSSERNCQLVFWGLLTALLAVCGYFIIHNAAWLIGDESIVYGTTGMGQAFSPLGFEGMITSYGRFYPFAYNLYNVLLLFGDGYISIEAHYILHTIALCIYALCFSGIGLSILKHEKPIWKYAITFCFVAVALFRVYMEFLSCYTGAWIVFLFLAIFIFSLCKFEETELWSWGIPAVLSITYICYCYETVFIIPLVYGASSLLFNFKNLTQRKKWFNGLLVASGLLFLLLYAIIVIPRASHYYGHQAESSLFINAIKMFAAQKIYWIALICFFVRLWDVGKRKRPYFFADSLLLASMAVFVGSAILHLNYTYYYNFGALLAITSILCYCNQYVKPYWTLLIMGAFFMLFGCKVPSRIKKNQDERVSTYTHVCELSESIKQGESVYWYAPVCLDSTDYNVDMRSCQQSRLEDYLEWVEQQPISIPVKTSFCPDLDGIWLYPKENDKLFPDSAVLFKEKDHMYSIESIRDIV